MPTPVLVGATYLLPSDHFVRVVGELLGGDLDCRFIRGDGNEFAPGHIPPGLRIREVRLTSRFLAGWSQLVRRA